MQIEAGNLLAEAMRWAHLDDADVQTPALVVDLERVGNNIRRAQQYCNRHGYHFRPHVKTHKLPEIARMQLAAGAVGITCQTLTEAETMADAGVGDILITYPILGEAKMRRLAALTASTSISIAADSPAAIDAAGAAAADAGRVIGFLVECDTGFGRLGVSSPAEAARLAALVAATPGLRFDGLMTYPTLEGSAALLAACRDAVEAVGLRVHVVSGGGTPTLYQTAELAGDVITEIRAGEYVFGDRTHLERGVVGAGELAAVVLTSVVGAPTDGRVILDAGSKTLSSDAAGEPVLRGFGLVAEYPDAVLYELSEEHAHVDVSRCATRPSIGERVAVIPNHICPCVNLAGRVLLRTASGTESVPVVARGVTGDRRDSREERR